MVKDRNLLFLQVPLSHDLQILLAAQPVEFHLANRLSVEMRQRNPGRWRNGFEGGFPEGLQHLGVKDNDVILIAFVDPSERLMKEIPARHAAQT